MSSSSPTIINGGGIISLSIAHCLALAQGHGTDISSIDSAPDLLSVASPEANGVLPDYDFLAGRRRSEISRASCTRNLRKSMMGRRGGGMRGP
ncbi:hypothetical protein PSPO01_01534 [Paraphaeosphaeria sporulosa]